MVGHRAVQRSGHRDRFHVIVVGAGAAGLMAAGQAAEMGARTLLLEKMDRPARKLRISGKGRGNLTNTAPVPEFIEHFANGPFLRNAFARFFSADLTAFFLGLGVRTLAERGGRVFPESNRAQDLVDAMIGWVRARGVTVRTGVRVHDLLLDEQRIAGVQALGTGGTEDIHGDAVIVTTGGASYPATGSTGDGYALARSVGHTVVPIRPALVPLETAGDVARRLQGLSLRNVRVCLCVGGKQRSETFGEMLFTHFGVSGPIILSMSRQVVDLVRDGEQVVLSIDLKPALDEDKLDARLRRDLDRFGKRQFRTVLKELLPRMLIPVCIDQTAIPAFKVGHQITAEERSRLRAWLKDFRLQVTGYRGFKEAIVTAGGVDTREIDPRTMASRRIAGLYFAGEVLDVDADTGGYNLQAAFSMGWVSGRAAASGVMEREQA
jgi:predicted Rossmann fold flavoprotein